MRLDRALSNLKFGSRKEVQEFIKKGIVKVNNIICKNVKEEVDENSLIHFNEEEVFFKPSFILMLYKPINYLSANKDNIHDTVIDLIKEPYNRYDLKICGRLDLDVEGLLLLTNVGSYVHQIASPNNKINKVYHVNVEKEITKEDIEKLLLPHILKDGDNNQYVSKAVAVEYIDKYNFLLTINQGKFHQVKRMCESILNKVKKLKRIQIGKLKLDINLTPGEYKEVKIEDIL